MKQTCYIFILFYTLECGGDDPIEENSPLNQSIDIKVTRTCNVEVKVEAWNINSDNETGDWFEINQYNTSGFDKFVSYFHFPT